MDKRNKCIIQGCPCIPYRRRLCRGHYNFLLKHNVFKKFNGGLSDESINEIYYEYARDTAYRGGYYGYLANKRS